MRPPRREPLAPHHALLVHRQQLLCVVREDLQRHGRRVGTVGAAVFDDGTRFGGQLIGGDRFDDGHGDDHSLRGAECALAACTLTLLLLMGTTIEPACRGPCRRRCCRRFSPSADRSATLNNGVLNEVSGVAASRLHPPLLWVHNDSGGQPAVYAIRPDGTLVSTVTIEGATNTDWEDIAVGPGPARGISYLFLGDIGDNLSGRDHITVYRNPEPRTTIAEFLLTGAETFSLRYPDHPVDAESMFVDPRSGDLFIIDKEYTSAVGRVFRAPKRRAGRRRRRDHGRGRHVHPRAGRVRPPDRSRKVPRHAHHRCRRVARRQHRAGAHLPPRPRLHTPARSSARHGVRPPPVRRPADRRTAG